MSRTQTRETDETLPVAEQASHWWAVVHDESCTDSELRAFADWAGRSPERIAAYLRIATLMHALKAPHIRWPEVPVAQLIREAAADPGRVVPIAVKGRPPRELSAAASDRWRPLRWLGPAAAVILAGLLTVWLMNRPVSYQTALGEQRSVLLDDGSLVLLNSLSRIEVTLGKQHRVVHLQKGEALFQVAHDAGRPFDVVAGATTVRAIGTQFDVDRRASRTTVTVVEGKVQVATSQDESPVFPTSGPPRDGPAATKSLSSPAHHSYGPIALSAGQRVVISGGQAVLPVPANLTEATAWTQRRLVFERRPLSEVVEEFNRYNRQQIQIQDPRLRSQEVTGVFAANDPASFLEFLAGVPGVRIEETAAGDHLVKAH